MSKKNKTIVTVIVIVVIVILLGGIWATGLTPIYGQSTPIERLKSDVELGKWDDLAAYFSDDSYLALKKYFLRCKSIKIISTENNNLNYKAKFIRQGEMGILSVEEKDGKFLKAQLKNQIRPMYFVETFKKYKAENITLKVGNATLYFKTGYFYETFPYRSLLLFEGEWTFYIKPDDREEQLTLIRQFKKDYISESLDAGILILAQKEFLKKLPLVGEVNLLENESKALYEMYRDNYGVKVKQFDEYWYLPFPQGTNFIVFRKDEKSLLRKDKKLFYYYSFNKSLTPDTQFIVSESNRLILSYNKVKGLKFAFGIKEKVKEVNLSIFYNPVSNYISGTTSIAYEEPANLRVLDLARELKLVGNLDPEEKGLTLFRKGDKYYLMGAESKNLYLFFNGTIPPDTQDYELFRTQSSEQHSKKSNFGVFRFLSRTENFYPNPGSEFFKSTVTVTVPDNLNCLVTGSLVEKKVENATVYKYQSPSTKGISMAVGNFKPSVRVDARIPIQFYIPDTVTFSDSLNVTEIKNAADHLVQMYGTLDLPSLNMLLVPGEKEGGISNTGFAVIYVPMIKSRFPGDMPVNFSVDAPRVERKVHSPILLREQTEDYIIHEMAHQWWGGVISWKTYQDVWITEGLAHFSVLYFLKKSLAERPFNRLIKKIKQWVYNYGGSGPIIYGNRINQLENNYEAYQSVVYNKSALMFLMLVDWLGEDEFSRRLNAVLREYKYQSVSSMQFIRSFCADNKDLLKFFGNWIYSRSMPVVELSLLKDHPDSDKQESKRVVLSIKQMDTDFVFPLKLEVKTSRGTTTEMILVKEKEQTVVISRDAEIRSVEMADASTLIKEKK